VLTSYPAFYLMAAWPSLAACVIAVGWLQLVKAGYSGLLPSLLSEPSHPAFFAHLGPLGACGRHGRASDRGRGIFRR